MACRPADWRRARSRSSDVLGYRAKARPGTTIMLEHRDHPSPAPLNPDQLNGWKEIGAYVGRGVRTAQRWEKTLQLPVHRIPTAGGDVVFAYRSEIDAWRNSSASAAVAGSSSEAARTAPTGLLAAGMLAAILVVVLASLAARPAAGPILRIDGRIFTQRTQGEVINFGGVGFTPGASPARSVRRPDGTVVRFEPVLSADPQGTLRGSVATDCSTPPGRYAMWYVDVVTSSTSNEVAWDISRSERCRGELADLVAESVTADRRRAAPGEVLTVTYQLRNAGAVMAPSTRTRLRLGGSALRSTVTDPVLGDDEAPALPPGASVSRTVVVPVPPVADGQHYIWIVADNDAVVPQVLAENDFARSEAIIIQRP
jgi:hypothetical protein